MGHSRVPRGRGKLVSRMLGLTLLLALMTTMTVAAVAAVGKSTFGVSVRDNGNCTMTATGSWRGAHKRVHQVTFKLTTNSPTYPATVSNGENAATDRRSGRTSVTFDVTRADTRASVRADFYSFRGAHLGTASSRTVRVACT